MGKPSEEAMKRAAAALRDMEGCFRSLGHQEDVYAAFALELQTLLIGTSLSKHGRIVSVELSGSNLAADLFNVLAAIRTRKQEDDR